MVCCCHDPKRRWGDDGDDGDGVRGLEVTYLGWLKACRAPLLAISSRKRTLLDEPLRGVTPQVETLEQTDALPSPPSPISP